MDTSPLYVIHTIRSGSATANVLPPPPPGRTLQRVWTLIDGPLLLEVGPMHNQSAFLEDQVHDWRVNAGGEFFYYSSATPIGVDVEIVLDYETSAERAARLSSPCARPRFDPMTGARLDPG